MCGWSIRHTHTHYNGYDNTFVIFYCLQQLITLPFEGVFVPHDNHAIHTVAISFKTLTADCCRWMYRALVIAANTDYTDVVMQDNI